jgi:predicted amidohydrolase YtcJ
MSLEADLLIVGARPWSDGASLVGADAIAVAGGRVLAVGRASELAALAGPHTVRLDARGATVTPGLWDAHLHLMTWARARRELALDGARSRDEVAARVRASATALPAGTLLVGRGWDAEGWPAPPHRAALDAVAPERPVLLHSHDFHAVWVNGAALALAGVTRATPDPDGGHFERDAAGEPTGIAREHAVRAFATLEREAAQAPGAAAREAAAADEAVAALNALGITGAHDFDPLTPDGPAAADALARAARGRLRLLRAIGHPALDDAIARGLASASGDDHHRLGPLKLFADGTLGSRTAAMLEPYTGGGTGMDLLSPRELRETVARALAHRLAVAVHAIGDRAARNVLDAFEAAGEAGRRAPLPCRLEHAQLVHAADLPRFAALGVAASMQPLHATADFERAERDWGTRAAGSYPWASLLASGATLAFGSDAPVEPPSVAAGLHAAVTRQRADGRPAGGFAPAERLTLDRALRAYTEAPARLAGVWPRVGRLAAGAAADLVVWDADLHALPAADLRTAAVAATLVEGRVVHARAPETIGAGEVRS